MSFAFYSTAKDDLDNLPGRIASEKDRGLPFGIRFLDDAFKRISPLDTILIGGRSGAGKTELVTHIAVTNAAAGKVVYYFALEAERGEIGARMAYKRYAKKFLDRKYRKYGQQWVPDFDLSYDAMMAGELDEVFAPFKAEVEAEINELNKNLRVIYSDDDYTIDDFEMHMVTAGQDANLIIIDHLHYFEIDEGNPNAEYKRILKRIRRIVKDKEIPVILVAHLRKQDKRYSEIVPDQEDFHGTSDIIKIVTKAITISSGVGVPCYYDRIEQRTTDKGRTEFYANRVPIEPEGYPTFIRPAKHRRNGSATMHIACVEFNPKTNCYEDGYMLGKQVEENKVKSFLMNPDAKALKWARGAQHE